MVPEISWVLFQNTAIAGFQITTFIYESHQNLKIIELVIWVVEEPSNVHFQKIEIDTFFIEISSRDQNDIVLQ